MNTEFWESCRRNSILIDVTLYPPLFSKKTELLLLAKSKGTAINAVETATFRVTTNSKGDSELEKTFRRCRKLGYWPILRQGRVYQCAKPAYGHYFNKAFGTTIPTGGSVDIYDLEVTGWKVLSHLEKSPEACRFCTYGWEKVPTQAWAKSCLSRKEWDVAEQ